MYAIVETGGKQYRVTPGDLVNVERLQGDIGTMITLDKVLLIGGKADSAVLVGKPYVAKATLQAEIVDQSRGDKIRIIKYKRRKQYRRQMGHRQELTRLLVTKIEDGTGQSLSFDAAKRAEVLRKASVATAEKAPKTAKAASEAKAPKAKAAAGTAKKKTAAKKA